MFSDTGFVCAKNTQTCDKGFVGHLVVGCDAPLVPANDNFSSYQRDCVFRFPPFPSVPDVYDSVCCFDSVFNGFELWKSDVNFSHVRVY